MSSQVSGSSSVPQKSLNSQIVLEEDEYTAALSRIIARDFFPSLVHLDATNEYLSALDTRDPHLISASIRRIEEINATPLVNPRRRPIPQTPSETPYALGGAPYDTPSATSRHPDEPLRKKPRYDDSLSLDTFQARYTSEDNSSFTDILESENQSRKERWAWAWEAQQKVERKQQLIGEARERLLLEGPSDSSSRPGVREKFLIEPPNPTAGLIEAGGGTADRGEELVKEEDTPKQVSVVPGDTDKQLDVMAPPPPPRHNGMDGWNFKTRNSLMFSPDADESPYYKHRPIEQNPADSRSLNLGSTRLPEQDDTTSTSHSISEPPSPTRSRINAAIQGTPYRPRSPTSNTFKLVPNLPSPTASELGPEAVKQLMTWGTLNATPRIISQSDDIILPPPSTPFHLPPPSKREQISHKLSNNASKSLRTKAGLMGLNRTPGVGTPAARKRGGMLPPSTPRKAEAAGNLTPAAKRLLDRTAMGALASRRAEAMERTAGWTSQQREKDLKQVRWTPTPGMR